MNRKIYFWKLPSTELAMGERTLIMGVLNVTPDSFSDGGRYSDPDRAYARALEMEEEGADIIDVGAESTRPDSKRVSAEEEWRRLLPVLKLLRDKLTVPLSLDTYKSEIAERALQFGVSIFNDPSGLTFDANLAKVAAEHNAGLILNHMRGTPETWAKQPALSDVMGAVSKDLEATISRARRAGVEKNRIVVDPGLGFGKRREQNSEILAHLARLAELDYPILVGPSRKSFLSHAAEGETAFATAAAVAVAVMNGAHIVRVHDVKEMRSAAQIADEISRTATAWRSAQEAASERAEPRPKLRGNEVRGNEARGNGGLAREDRPGPPRPPLLPLVQKPLFQKPLFQKTEQKEAPRVLPVEIPALERPLAMPKAVEPVRPAEVIGDRPVFRRPAADRPPRRDSADRPPRQEFRGRPTPVRPAGEHPSGGRPAWRDKPGSDRPRPPRPAGDRTGDRPARPFGDRPPRAAEDRPVRNYGDRPAGPGDRGRGDGSRGGRPVGSSGPPKGGPPRGDGRRGDSSRGDSRGGDKRGRPPGDRPSRPFRKRP